MNIVRTAFGDVFLISQQLFLDEIFAKQAHKLGRCNGYFRNLTTLPTDPLTDWVRCLGNAIAPKKCHLRKAKPTWGAELPFRCLDDFCSDFEMRMMRVLQKATLRPINMSRTCQWLKTLTFAFALKHRWKNIATIVNAVPCHS